MQPLDNGLRAEHPQHLYRRKPLWNALAIGYTLLGYFGSLVLVCVHDVWLNLLGMTVLTHCLVCSVFLSHEFMHGNIFGNRRRNALGCNLMLWLNGGCYASFVDLARQHMAHHVRKVDYEPLNLAAFLQQRPGWVRKLLLALEWLYVPALSFVVHLRAVALPLWHPAHRSERRRTLIVLAIRVLLFTALGVYSLRGLLGYVQAYATALLILRFEDAFQHTYEAFPVNVPVPVHDRAYERANTFSTVLSRRHGWLNLLMLNFGYHGAHHTAMNCPWHNLPALDRALFPDGEARELTWGQRVEVFHRCRVERVFAAREQAFDEQGQFVPERFIGTFSVPLFVKV